MPVVGYAPILCIIIHWGVLKISDPNQLNHSKQKRKTIKKTGTAGMKIIIEISSETQGIVHRFCH